MFIRVQDKDGEEKYCVEAAWIKWNQHNHLHSIAAYMRISKTKSTGESKIEVAVVPTMYIHLNDGDTVSVINNAGKVIAEKQIGRAYRKAIDESIGLADYNREHNPDHQ